jgi:hypothetical protein
MSSIFSILNRRRVRKPRKCVFFIDKVRDIFPVFLNACKIFISSGNVLPAPNAKSTVYVSMRGFVYSSKFFLKMPCGKSHCCNNPFRAAFKAISLRMRCRKRYETWRWNACLTQLKVLIYAIPVNLWDRPIQKPSSSIHFESGSRIFYRTFGFLYF